MGLNLVTVGCHEIDAIVPIVHARHLSKSGEILAGKGLVIDVINLDDLNA